MNTEAYKPKVIEYGLTLLLASLPSLYLLVRYPPFFNGFDALCFFNFPTVVPHYPLFYPLYCFLFLRIFGDGPVLVYAIVISQHILYTCSIAYIAIYFEKPARRILFLISVFLAFRATIYIHGVYTETWAIIAIGFIMGSLLRIAIEPNRGRKKFHYSIYAVATLLLLLTRFAGLFMVFILPLFLMFRAAKNKSLLTKQVLKSLVIQTGFSFMLIVTAQLISNAVLLYYHASDLSVYGRPGTYRISDALNPRSAVKNPDEVLAIYKSCTNDTLVRLTFDLLKSGDREKLWMGCYLPVDSLRRKFIGEGLINGTVTSDDCLEAAYRIYLSQPGYYPYRAIKNDFFAYLFNPKLLNEVIEDVDRLVSSDDNMLPRMKRYLIKQALASRYDKAGRDYLLIITGFLIPPFLILFSLVAFLFSVPWDIMLLNLAVIISAISCHLLTAIITACELRYVQPAEFAIYIMFCVLVASLFSNNRNH